jgi:hypothetical protein
MCTAVPTSHPDLNALLEQFLAGDARARDQFPRAARPYLIKFARRLARELPDEIQQEAVNQSLLNLTLQKPANYDPKRGSAKTFLRFMLTSALRQVRASYTPPGHMTRRRGPKGSMSELPSLAVPHVRSLDDLDEADMPTIDGGITAAEARHDVRAILRYAPAHVATTLDRVYLQEHVLNDVATELGLSRYTLSRQVNEFTRGVRAADA